MKKFVLVALSSLMIIGTATTAIGDGRVKVSFNQQKSGVEVAASQTNSVIDVVERLGGFAAYERNTANLKIEKPNVNLLILEGIQQNRNKDIVFSNPIMRYYEKDIARNFGVFVEVDNVPEAREVTTRVRIVAPNGRVVENGKERKFSAGNNSSFFFSQSFIATKLEQFGTYKVQVVMKKDKGPEVVVGENSFTVGNGK